MSQPAPVGRILSSRACLDEGVAWLCDTEPRFVRALALAGPPPLRRRPEGFAELLAVILGQQVSTASASALRARLEALDLMRPEALAKHNEEDLRGLGLSRQKARYVRALAQSGLDFEALRDLPDAQVIARLTELPGIGRWTAEVYAMFSLGRADVFAPGDLALQEAARLLFDLPDRPRPAALAELARAWSPWRAVAARVLWAYYRVARGRDGIAT